MHGDYAPVHNARGNTSLSLHILGNTHKTQFSNMHTITKNLVMSCGMIMALRSDDFARLMFETCSVRGVPHSDGQCIPGSDGAVG